MNIEIVGNEIPLFTSALTKYDYGLEGKRFSTNLLRIDTCPWNVNLLSDLAGRSNHA